jgi:hypothetical protein
MIAHSFTFTVTSTRKVRFTAPSSLATGSNCQFNITITDPQPNGTAVLLGNVSFVRVIPADRVITFTCATSIPLGSHRFTCLITTLSAAVRMAVTSMADDEGVPAGADGTMANDVADPA